VINPTEARNRIVQQMARYGMTPAMCADKSNATLLGIAAMTVAHRRSQGKLEAHEIIQLGKLEKIVYEVKQVS
jgi:hypothetical protein